MALQSRSRQVINSLKNREGEKDVELYKTADMSSGFKKRTRLALQSRSGCIINSLKNDEEGKTAELCKACMRQILSYK